MNEQIKTIIKKVISCFENSTSELQYDYCENLNDGRGFTCGIAGFTTADGDALTVIDRYNKEPISNFIPHLNKLEANNSDSVLWLNINGFKGAWKRAALDQDFRDAQDALYDETYLNPAVDLANSIGVTSNLGALIFVDTCIQHGFEGPDSLKDIVERTEQQLNIGDFLANFLTLRRSILLNPQDPSTQAEWSQSVGRVDALKAILDAGNLDLATPFTTNPWGDQEFTID